MIDPLTLAAVASTAFLSVFAKGFGDFIYELFRKKSETKVTIRTADGREINVTGLKPENVADLIVQLKSQKKQPSTGEDDSQKLTN